MSTIKYFSDKMVPLIGVNPKCIDDFGRCIDYFNAKDLPLDKKRNDGYFILDDKVGFNWDATCCSKRLGKSYKKYRRYVLKIADSNKSDSHDVERSIEVVAREDTVRNLCVNILDRNIRAFFWLGRDIDCQDKKMTFIKSGITLVKDDIKRERSFMYDIQGRGFTIVEMQESMYNGSVNKQSKESRRFRVNDSKPKTLLISRDASNGYYPDFIETKKNAGLIARGMLYHPEVNGTIRIVEKTINLAFPRIMDLVANMFPEYYDFVNGTYEPVSGVHEEIEATKLEDCSKFDVSNSLLWVPTLRKK